MKLLMVSNQTEPMGHAGVRDAYEDMLREGVLTSFDYVTPRATRSTSGHGAALAELERIAQTAQPDVLLVTTPNGFGHDRAWVTRLLRLAGGPIVIYYEGDAFGARRWAKPINNSMRSWLSVSDIVFSVAREPQATLFKAAGARDVRFCPSTYDHVVFRSAERERPSLPASIEDDVVVIGSRLARGGYVSLVPGAAGRAKLVRRLDRQTDLRLAVYGSGWRGGAAKGPLPFESQIEAIRKGLISANWNHFPTYEAYTSNRLPISLLAGRPHVTTAHSRYDWLPGEDKGLHLAGSVDDAHERVLALAKSPPADLLSTGVEAHRWVRDRLSDRQAARFWLAAVRRDLLNELPRAPWQRLAEEWPD